MNKLFLLLSLALVLSGCSSSPTKPTPTPETPIVVVPPVETAPPVVVTPPVIDFQPADEGAPSIPIGPEYPIKNPTKVFTVKITDTNYTTKQKEKLAKAAAAIEKVVNGSEFQSKVLNNIYKNKAVSFDSNNGLSNEQILKKLASGAEALLPAVNYQMDLTVTMYRKSNSVVGYTYPSSMVVNTNSKFHDNYDECEVAGNLFHEWTHKMGFGHKTATSYNSVPYSLGYTVRDLCKAMK